MPNGVTGGWAGSRKLVRTGGVASGGAAEYGARAETAPLTLSEIAPPMGDLFANPAARQAMLDDAGFDVESWLASEIAVEFARADGHAFVHGSGTNQPKGFLQAATPTAADAVPAFGKIGRPSCGGKGCQYV